MLLILSVLIIVLLSFVAPGPTRIDTAATGLIQQLPGLFGWFWEVSFDLLIFWALLLLALALFARGRKRLLLDEVLAGTLALGFALIAGKVGGTDWGASLGSLTASGSPPVYLAVRLAIATAVVVTASPHMSRPFRHAGRWVLGIGAVAGIALGVTLPIGMVAGFIIGIGSAALVHLVVGSPGGRLTLEQISAALLDLGVVATDLRNAPLQLRGVALATATSADGRPLLVKVYGRDAWDGQLVTSVWSSLWHRGETPRFGSGRLEQVEHEAFLTLLAQREGVPVRPVVAAGLAAGRDAVLVIEASGRPFSSLEMEQANEGLLVRLWGAMGRLHEIGVAHGRVDGQTLIVLTDGTPAIADLGDARVAAIDSAMHADDAQLLVTTALAAGVERAFAAAVRAIGVDGLAEVLPFLQPAALDRETRRSLHDGGIDLDDMRKRAAETAGVEPPALEQLRRVSGRSIVMVALIAFIAYALISAITGIGLQNIVDELKSASGGWLLLALLLSPVIQVAEAFSTMGASIHPVRYGPVLMLEYAIQFIALAVPSSAARVALEVRFFERVGVEPGGAIAISVIDSLCGFAIQVLLIVGITLSGLASLDLSAATSSSSSSSSSSSGGGLLALMVVLLVLGAIIALAVPRYRSMIRQAVPRYRSMIRSQASASGAALRVLRSPSKLALIFSGNLSAQILQAIILGICLRAFGYHATLAELILVNTFVSLFAGLMPVPGGMGVAEAGYTAGLVALGIPNTVAVSTAIAFRLVTFYLPPIWGSFAMRWLRAHAFV